LLKIIYPNDNWILGKIGQELLKANITLKADVTYYINWMYWKHLNSCSKSECDIVFFTHIDKDSDISVLKRADWIFCMSEHGRHELKKYKLDSRAKVIAGFGLSVEDRKIRLGIAGRPYENGRKGQQLISNLYKVLDKDIFEFVFASDWQLPGRVSNNFFYDIDWLFIASESEGGPMDVLNAKALNISVISKDIGFMYSLKDEDDIIYENYDVLALKLKQLEEKINSRKKLLSVHNWDNFIDWHKKEFRKIEDCNLHSNNGQ
jgi:hypothetical protein